MAGIPTTHVASGRPGLVSVSRQVGLSFYQSLLRRLTRGTHVVPRPGKRQVQVDVLFQDGCNHVEKVQIFDDNFQVWPSNRGEELRGNATVVSFREFYELTPGNTILTAKTWTTLTSDIKEVIIQIGLLPKRIIQPMAFEELLAAAAGIE